MNDADTAEVLEKPIAELHTLLRSKQLSSEQLVTQCLERIERFDQSGPSLRSLIAVADDALEQARARDAECAHGGAVGSLHGIPVVLKDNIETATLPTTAGSRQFEGYQPRRDAPVAKRLVDAGAIVIGKANLHEFSYGLTTLSSLGGQTRNPYDLHRNPGGSSGGTAVAVTSGFAVAGIGTDTGGSIRFPAAHANLFGLRPTVGLLPQAGIVPLSRAMDTAGPITHHACDLAELMAALTGSNQFGAHIDPSHVRIAVLEDYFGTQPGEEGTSDTVREALSRLEASGVQLVFLRDLDLNERAGDTALFEFEDTLNDYLATAEPAPPAETVANIMAFEALTPGVREHMRAALALSGNTAGLREAVKQRTRLRSALAAVFKSVRVHALAYPTFKSTARPLAEEYWEGSNAMLSSVPGLPAVTVPVGFSDGLPVGLELLGPALSEPQLIAVAETIERIVPSRRAPVLG